MKILTVVASFTFLMAGCSGTAPISTPPATSAKAPDVSDQIRKSLDQAALNDVSIKQDRDKGVVTLGGHVPSDSDRSRAESIAKDIANGQVVSNEIGVIPPAIEDDAKRVNSDHDKAIAKNLDAALVQNRLKEDVRYDVKNAVVTLKGKVSPQSRRAEIARIASAIPNVRQVVNELQPKD